MLTDFQNSFTDRFNSKFATKPLLIIPLHLNYVTTVPCEISKFKKLPCSRPESMSKLSRKTQPPRTVVKIS